jgi:hypothetical protein
VPQSQSVGLTHNVRAPRGNDCMVTENPMFAAEVIYNDHHVDHINQQR